MSQRKESISTASNSTETDSDIPLASVLFALVGVGYLFPFSALTQPVDYWHLIFPDFNIEFPLTTLYLWSNLLCLGLIVFLGGEPSYTMRIVGGFAGQLLVLAFVPTLYFFHFSESVHFVLVMLATTFAACATAFVDSVAISFSAQYPLRVQEALQFGIGLSTLIGSVYRILTKIAFPPSQVVESSLLYFYSGAATIILCIGAYYYLLSLPISKRYLQFGVGGSNSSDNISSGSGSNSGSQYQAVDTAGDDIEQRQPAKYEYIAVSSSLHPKLSPDLSKMMQRSKARRETAATVTTPLAAAAMDTGTSVAASTSVGSNSNSNSVLKSSASSEDLRKPLNGQRVATFNKYGGTVELSDRSNSCNNDNNKNTTAPTAAGAVEVAGVIIEDSPQLNKWALLRKAAFNEFFVFLLFFSTLLLWPPLVTEIKSFNFPHLQETRWWPLLLLGLFALADCIGRTASRYRMGLTADNIWIAVLARFALFPMIICSVKGVVFTNDFFSVLFVFILGFTNGYLGTLTILMVNDRLEEHEKGIVGTFTGFFLNCGLVGGATAAYLVQRLVLG